MEILKSNDRGQTKLPWLDSKHSFSFGEYYNPDKLGFKSLRVINEDVVQPNGGFGTHGHRDMEILTYIISGKLAHKDSMGNEEILYQGDFQKMTAGTGIQHSEYNASADEICHLYQIWLTPREKGLTPSYQQTNLKNNNGTNTFKPILTPDSVGDIGDSMTLHQDAWVYFGTFEAGTRIDMPTESSLPNSFLQVIEGTTRLGDQKINPGDAIYGSGTMDEQLVSETASKVILFNL